MAVAALPATLGAPASVAAQQLPRPLRLFERPEPIEAIALLPDGPPLKFRWRRTLHEIVAYEGPERLAPPWWGAKDAALTRDYFHARDGEGRLFWLFREGFCARETDRPPWYVHGLSSPCRRPPH
jgi:protein ImuB